MISICQYFKLSPKTTHIPFAQENDGVQWGANVYYEFLRTSPQKEGLGRQTTKPLVFLVVVKQTGRRW